MGFAHLSASLLLGFGNLAPFAPILGFISTMSQEAPDYDRDMNLRCSMVTERSRALGTFFTEPLDSV